MIDTHAHLDACERPSAEMLGRARAAGVERVVTVGSGIDSCKAALELADRHPGVYAAVGIHPHQAGGAEASRLGELRELLDHEQAVAVGETGLDFFRDLAPRERQRQLFAAHLELAADTSKAVVVHNREADEETAEALEGFGGTVILHCFSSPPLLATAVERGYYVSFAGNVTFPRADDLRQAAARVPSDRLLAETDSPYLAPQPLRGKANEPANIVHTLATLATARGEEAEALAAQIDENASAAFGLAVTTEAP